MMYIETASPQDARAIAKVYREAFPDSVRFFFPKKPEEQLLELLELTFLAIFHRGGQAALLKDEESGIIGYCFYLNSTDKPEGPRWGQLLRTLGQMARKITLCEAARLLYNQLVMAAAARRTEKTPKPQAQILSVAISPVFQGQGLGTRLLRHAIKELRPHSIGLNVRMDNLPGRRLYASTGFLTIGATRDLTGEWLILRKPSDI